ncbi:PREDICTED: odorant receptor 13a-like [Wasmannia auropunctata]|uniref:odorant receptor 13a-like n=1 Tax=Wasmannia auropunctata TaxID=64793 RepID=UPI0005EEF797|nr:PREDICTED: odorant receptor 13a-like [Wasmannia auropunctata]
MKYKWNHYYSLLQKILSLAGQWPYQERRTRLFRVGLITVAIFSLTVPQVGKFIQCNGDVRCIMLIVPTGFAMLIILVKLYTCHLNNSKIKSLTDHLRSDWEKLESAEEYEIMKTYAANSKLFCSAFCLYMYISAGMFVSISLVPHIMNVVLPLNESWPIFMPYEAYYFVDIEKYFFYIFIHVFVSIEIGMTVTIAHDSMIVVYMEHACSIFAVAGFRFQTLSRNVRDDAISITSPDDVYYQKIAISVYAHWRALRFAELLESTFYVTFAVQILIVTIAMSITLLQIVLRLDEVLEAMRYTLFVIVQVVHLFYFSMQGQRLIDHSVQMRDKIYNSSWYNIPAKSQRLLLYVMRRSMQPNFLSAGKIYIFSLKSFTTVVQSSVSYFTVLASFQ